MANWLIIAVPCIGMALDVLTGYVAAALNGEVDSKVMKRGIFGKLGEVCAICVGFLAEFALSVFGPEYLGLPVNVPVGTSVCAYVFLTELVSNVENIGSMNEDLGGKMVSIFGIDPKKVHINNDEEVK